jgi:hypothetical protein
VQKLFTNVEKFINKENSFGGVGMEVFFLGLHKLGLAIILDLSLFGGLPFLTILSFN